MSTNYTNIYNYDLIADAAIAMLSSSISSSYGLIDIVRSPRTLVVGSTPVVQIKYINNQAIGHYALIYNTSGSVIGAKPDVFSGNIQANIITTRETDNSYHAGLVSLCKYKLSEPSNYILDYHQILNVIDGGTSTSTTDDQNLDETILTYNITMAIKSDAWPNTI